MSAAGRTRWGWHELDSATAGRLVELAAVEPNDLAIDAGAGRGVITSRLVAAGAHVIAVELHERRAAQLRVRFRGSPVTVVHADVADLRLPRRPFVVVANPPFASIVGLMRRLLSRGSRLDRGVLVVPVYLADRWVSHPRFVVRVAGSLPAHAFHPRAPRAAKILVVARRH